MQTSLSTELFWFCMTIGMTVTMWIPYIINRMVEWGILSAFWGSLWAYRGKGGMGQPDDAGTPECNCLS